MAINIAEEESPEVQMAPLIDCVFLLLIFFLVATTMKKIERELPIELPDSAAAIEVQQPEGILSIGIDRQGGFYINAEPVGYELLHATLREAAQSNPEQRIRIDGDRLAPFESIVHILDLCEFEGLKNVAIHSGPDRTGQ